MGVLNLPIPLLSTPRVNSWLLTQATIAFKYLMEQGSFCGNMDRKGGEMEFKEPGGVAFDHRNHQIVVADTLNHRIQIFDEKGTFIRAFGSKGKGKWSVRVT